MNKQEIRDLMRFFDKSGINRVKIKDGEFSIELQKGFDSSTVVVPSQSAAPAGAPMVSVASVVTGKVENKENESKGESIKSPMVGTFYTAPSPGSEPFVKVGTVVRKGQTIAIIEAMKIMNEIEAEFDCRITEMLVDDGTPVEFDMPLFGVEKV
ncbi:MAG: acetyl-CoA carboxylase biotin carboxyl carrier protein [Epsilonproteobacteria bacterium]|nr:acetyl-CoA carboxylase biotin carboxyl carrier protein [Campylobacterota bacterium]